MTDTSPGRDVPAADERRHPSADGYWWGESWYFDFAATDGSLGGYVRLGLYPNQRGPSGDLSGPRAGIAWYWAYLVRAGRPLVAVRNHEVALPRTDVLEVRADGLWSAITCETPHDHWSIGLEAFGVALDDPLDAYRGEWGEKVAFGLDLEWEAAAPVFPYPGTSRYEQTCVVHGDVLVGDERIAFEGFGERDHSWGERDWWKFGWCWTAARLDDGTAFHAAAIPASESFMYAPGFVARDGELMPTFGLEVQTELGAEGLPVSATMQLGDLELTVMPIGFAPILLEGADGRVARLPRAMCRFESATGASGYGWTEWNQPQP